MAAINLSARLFYRKKLKASTLIEILVASVIILGSFVITITIINRISGENDVLKKIDVNNYINYTLRKHPTTFRERTSQSNTGWQLRSEPLTSEPLLKGLIVESKEEEGMSGALPGLKQFVFICKKAGERNRELFGRKVIIESRDAE